MKIRSLLTLVAMLSILLLGIGTAHAIYGVPDDVPGQDLVWPIMCVKAPSASNNLNTNWAIADLIGGVTNLDGNVVATQCVLRSVTSSPVFDFGYVWTPFDVVTDNCQALLATTTPANRTALTVTINGTAYYAGYIVCQQVDVPCLGGLTCTSQIHDRFMNNVYLVDTPLGFASAFNGPSIEGNGTTTTAGTIPAITPTLGENNPAGGFEVVAEDVYFRYYLNNTDPNTWDWWILLLGRNQYNTFSCTSTRILDGIICDEEEHCLSVQIPIPNELNILNVADFLPGSPLDTTFPRAGFGAFSISESGNRTTIGPYKIVGTANVPVCGGTIAGYSAYGWSYQRAVAASLIGDFDVIHPMFRRYCTSGSPLTTDFITPTFPGGSGPTDNLTPCGCVGAGC